jgi:hypothetical protein
MERLRRLLSNNGKRSPWLWAGPVLGAVATFVAAYVIMPDVPLLAKVPIAMVMATYMVVQAAMYIYRDEAGPDDHDGGAKPAVPEPPPPTLRIRIEAHEVSRPVIEKELEPAGRR